jgi:hypothetical protein
VGDVTLELPDGRRLKAHPFERFATVDAPCGWCGSMHVRGTGKSIESRDTYRADAVCFDCGASRGVLRVKVDTLFGLEEDEAVLHGRARVYG